MVFAIKRLSLAVAVYASMSWAGCGSGGEGQPGTVTATGGSSAGTGGLASQSGGASGNVGGGSTGGQSGAPATATGGQQPGTGGGAGAGTGGAGSGGSTSGGGSAGSGAAGAGTASGGMASTGGAAAGLGGTASGGAGAAGGSAGTLEFKTDRIVITAVRATTNPAATMMTSLVDLGATPVGATITIADVSQVGTTFTPTTHDAKLTALASGNSVVQLANPTTSAVTVSPGSALPIVAGLSTTTLPAAPPQDSGATVIAATLTATGGGGAVQIPVYGLILTQALWEPTLGEILFTLGYKLNVGMAQNNSNPNRGKTPQQLPGVEAGTDEVAASLFKRVGSGPVTLTPVARFSPVGALPFGWYPATMSAKRNVVGTMAQGTDAQTSDKARMVFPPLAAGGGTTFDPGTEPFGVWVYSGEASTNGNPSYGDYTYSQDSLNSPGGCHRFKVYPLRDATGRSVPDSFLLAVEEAANGDYQDYVLVLGNVSVAP
jgi:hypothetical protein